MLKRLVGVITIKDGWAVQSIGYQKYLPLGRPEVIAENYDRWQLDEILVVDIDRTKLNMGPNYDLLEKIIAKRIMTPLCYLGGVRNIDDALHLINKGADRIAIDSLFLRDPESALEISHVLGRQALVRVQPLVIRNSEVHGYDYLRSISTAKIDPQSFVNMNYGFSELMIVDVENEGKINSFSDELIAPFRGYNLQLICFGGITSQIQISSLFKESNISAVAIGNSLSYTEIPHKKLIIQTEVDIARMTSFGAMTRGARDW